MQKQYGNTNYKINQFYEELFSNYNTLLKNESEQILNSGKDKKEEKRNEIVDEFDSVLENSDTDDQDSLDQKDYTYEISKNDIIPKR